MLGWRFFARLLRPCDYDHGLFVISFFEMILEYGAGYKVISVFAVFRARVLICSYLSHVR